MAEWMNEWTNDCAYFKNLKTLWKYKNLKDLKAFLQKPSFYQLWPGHKPAQETPEKPDQCLQTKTQSTWIGKSSIVRW